jgi:hypothetical protein
MSIDGVNGRTSYIGTSILNIRSSSHLTQQLPAAGLDDYAGRAPIAACPELARAGQQPGSFADTAKNVNIRLNVVNLALRA